MFSKIALILLFFCVKIPVFAVDLRINEFSPDSSPEWIEFYNASSSAEYIKNYYIDDDTSFTDDGGSNKKLLTDLNITNSTYPYIDVSSFLNNDGDFVVLFDASGVIIDQYQYSGNPGNDVTIGRNPNGSGGFATLASATKGSENSGVVSPTNTPTPTPQRTATPTPTPINTPTPTRGPTMTPTPTKKATSTIIPTPTIENTSETIETASETPVVLGDTAQKRNVKPIIISLLLVGIGCAILSLVFIWKKRSILKK